jgi:transposase
VVAFPAKTTEAFLEGPVRAFAYFGGVLTRVLYDNTKNAVAKIQGKRPIFTVCTGLVSVVMMWGW